MTYLSRHKKTLSVEARGFTLIELLIVLLILGISVSLLAPDMYGLFKRTQVKNEISSIRIMTQLAIEQSFFANNDIEVTFKENKLSVSELNNSVETGDTQLNESNKQAKVSEFISEFFTFKETNILISRGEWQNKSTIKLSHSPYDELNELVILDCKNGEAC